MTTISAEAGWGTVPDAFWMPKGCSTIGRKFKGVTVDSLTKMLPLLLQDTNNGRVYLHLDYEGTAPGTVNIEIVPFDMRRCLDTGDEAEYFAQYMIELETRVRAGRRQGKQFLTAHKHGWFAIESPAKQSEPFIVEGVESDWVPYWDGFDIGRPNTLS